MQKKKAKSGLCLGVTFAFLIHLFLVPLHCQTIDFKNFTQEDGLPSSVISAIKQDSHGFLWFGTEGAGLVKYDGSNFKIYDDANGLAGAFINDLEEDDQSNLLIATNYEGLLLFNGKSVLKKFNKSETGVKSNSFFKIVKTDKGFYCIGQSGIILIKKNYNVELIFQKQNTFEVVNSALCNKYGSIIIGTSNGLYLWSNDSLIRFNSKQLSGHVFVTKGISDELYITSANGTIYKMTDAFGKKGTYLIQPFINLPAGFTPKILFPHPNGDLWLGGEGNYRLLLYRNNSFRSFGEINGFKGEDIKCISNDFAGNTYIGTGGNGVYKTGSQLFANYLNTPLLNNPLIFSVVADSSEIWVGIRKKGTFRFTISKQEQIELTESYADGEGSNVIFKNTKNEVLLGTTVGLFKLKDKKKKQVLPEKNNGETFDIRAIKQAANGNYLIGTYGNGLLIADQEFKILEHFKLKDNLSDYVSTIEEFAPGQWLIGGNTGNIMLKEIKPGNYEVGKCITTIITAVSTKDSYGHFWFAGNACIYTISGDSIIKYTKKNKLTSTLIYTLIADKHGNIWAGSNMGLDQLKVNAKSEIIAVRNYNFKNGFIGLETNMRGQCADPAGNFYVATSRGLIKCLTGNNPSDNIKQSVVISNLKIANQDVDWNSESGKNNRVNLPDSGHVFKTSENQLTFRFSVLNGQINDYRQFVYKLMPVDKNWSSPTSINEVSYTNLKPGKYNFIVSLTGINGEPSGITDVYSFSIDIPFYQNWWFILGASLIFCLLIILIFSSLSSFNKDFVLDRSGRIGNDEIQLYVLFLGIVAPVTEIVIELSGARQQSELIANIVIGVILVSSYFLSKRSEYVAGKLYVIMMLTAAVFFLNSAYKISTGNTEVLTIIETLLVFFFSFILFKNTKRYWWYMILIFAFVISLFFNPNVSMHLSVSLAVGCVFIVLMNYASHITFLNNTEKMLFANNIVNNGNSLAIATNKMGQLSFCSNNVEKILGYKPNEVLGLKFWELTEDKDFEHVDYSQKFVKDKIYIRKLKCKDGNYKYIQWIDTRYSDDLFVGIGQDVSERIHLEEQYRKMVQNATDLIFETDEKGYFTFLNNVVTEVIGYTPDELIGRRFTELIRQDYVIQMFKLYFIEAPENKEFGIVEFPIISKNGEEHWVSQKVNTKRDDTGKIIGYYSIVRDITETKTIELKNKKRQEKRNVYNSVLNELATDPDTSSLGFEEAVKNILNRALEVMEADRITVWRSHKDHIECTFEVCKNQYESHLHKVREKLTLSANNHKDGEPFVANDLWLADVPESRRQFFSKDVKSLIEIPIFGSAEFSGLISCEMHTKARNWEEEDVSFARSLSDILSLLLETRKRQKIEKQLAFRNEISLAVARFTEKLLKSQDVKTTIKSHLEIVGDATRVSRIYFYSAMPPNTALHLEAEFFANKIQPVGTEILDPVKLGPLHAYVKANQVFEILPQKINDNSLKTWLAQRNSLSTLIIPVYSKDGLYGIIGLDDCHKERLWANSHLVILKALSDNIANAVDRLISEHKIKESESNFRQINETIQDVFWLYDYLKKKYLYVSPNSLSILGVPSHEFYDSSYRNRHLIFEEDVAKRREMQMLLNQTGYYEVEYRINCDDGTYKWISEKSYAIRDSSGTLIRNSGTCRDITEKKKNETELKQLSVVAEKTTNGVLITNGADQIIWANQGFLDMFEVTLDKIEGKSQTELFIPDNEISYLETQKLEQSNFTRELKMRTYTGKLKWIELNCTKIHDENGNVSQRIEVLTDITERMEHQNTLLRYSNDLEFQGTLQKKIINAQSYEELTLETLSFISNQLPGITRISLVRIDPKNDHLSGHALVNGKLIKVTYKASQTSSYHTLLEGQTYIERDLANKTNMSASDLEELNSGVGSYLVLPIMNMEQLIGSLYISFAKVLELEHNQIKNLESFTTLFSVALRQLDLTKELSVRNKNVVDSLIYARYIQNALLPDLKQVESSFKEVCLYFKPKDIVSGDFYWTKEVNGLTYIALADCTGHGVPGAFLTVLGSRILEELIVAEKITDPATILQKLDEKIYRTLNSKQNEIIRDGMEIGLCVVDRNNNKLSYSGSGRALLYFKNGINYLIPGHRRIIGDFDRPGSTFTTAELNIHEADIFFLFSDGYYDQLGGPDQRRYSKQKLFNLLKKLSEQNTETMAQELDKEIEAYRGNYPQTDDIAVIAFKI